MRNHFLFFKLIDFNWRLITLQYCGGFAIHWHESALGVHVSHILNPPLTSLPTLPSWLSQSTGFECPASCIKLGLVIYFTYGYIHVSMVFYQIIPPSPSPIESKSLFFISVSPLLSHVEGHHWHLSRFHIYALIHCISVLLSELLHSI